MVAYRVLEDGRQVARVDGEGDKAFSEAMHYGALYAQDGLPVRIERRQGAGWKHVASWVGRKR